MPGPVKKGATYADVVDLPDNVIGEIIGGELWVTPRPRVRHSAAQVEIARELSSRFRWSEGGPGGWWVLVEPELHLGPSALVPDLAAWRTLRLPHPDPSAPFLSVAPDWVCEIVSPATARLDRVVKLPEYARAGVGFAWVVDPEARSLEVLRLEGGHWTLAAAFADGDTVRAEPFDAAEIELARWWLPGD